MIAVSRMACAVVGSSTGVVERDLQANNWQEMSGLKVRVLAKLMYHGAYAHSIRSSNLGILIDEIWPEKLAYQLTNLKLQTDSAQKLSFRLTVCCQL